MLSRVSKSNLATVASLTWVTLACARLCGIELAFAATERRALRFADEWPFRWAAHSSPHLT